MTVKLIPIQKLEESRLLPRNRYRWLIVVKLPIKEKYLMWFLDKYYRSWGVEFVVFVIMCDRVNNVTVDGYTIEAEAGASSWNDSYSSSS